MKVKRKKIEIIVSDLELTKLEDFFFRDYDFKDKQFMKTIHDRVAKRVFIRLLKAWNETLK